MTPDTPDTIPHVPTSEEIGKIVGDNIRAIRQAKGYSQRHLGEVLGLEGHVATMVISNYERGVKLPGLDRLFEIADVLGVPAAELLDEA